MCAFVIGGADLECIEDFIREFVGLVKIDKRQHDLWILEFEDKESATCAQWQLDLQGAKGI